MRLKKLGSALVAAAALGAVLASSALAVAVTEDVKWYTGVGSGTELTGSETMTAEAVGTATFTTELSGVRYKLESPEVECVGCKIENVGGTAVGSGQLKFKKITVAAPAGCTAPSEITTNALSVTADWMIGTTNYIKFVPTKGESTAFAAIEITGCSSATSIVPKGSVFVESANATVVLANPQEVHSSKAINETAGGSFHVGTETAVLAADAKFRTKSGVAFGTHSASVVAVTEDVKWYTGVGSGTELTGSETMTAEAVGTATFTTELSGVRYKLESPEVECVGCKIENVGGVAVGSGQLRFKKITVAEPAGCSAPAEITSTALSVTADWMIGTTNYIKFVPTKGETTAFFLVEVTGCPSSVSIILKGSLFVRSVNATGVQAVFQEVGSSEAINAEAGGALRVGTEPVALVAKLEFRMSGAKAGQAFGTH